VWAWSSFVLGASVTPLVVYRLKPSAPFLFASFLVFGGFSVFNAFKDYKDIRADYRAGNQTLYVLALKRGVRLRPLHRGLCVAFLIALLIAPALLLATGGASALWAAITCSTLPFVARAIFGPPRGSSVRAFLYSVTLYLVALIGSIELSGKGT
jgi:4-hydroxybenzoate polyprenyltransferase